MKGFVRRLWRISISLKFAVVVMLGLTLALIVATILESIYDTPTAQYWVYQTIYFYGLLALLGWLILAVALSRLPWQKRHLPFLTAHLGILILLYGSWLTFQFGIDGSMQVSEGQTESTVELNEPLLLIASNGGNSVGAPPLMVKVPWQPPNAKFRPIEVPEYGLTIEKFISRAESKVSFVPAGEDTSVLAYPAIRVRLAGGPTAPPFMRMGQEVWLWAGEPTWTRQRVGPALLEIDSEFKNPDSNPSQASPVARFKVDSKKSVLEVGLVSSEGKSQTVKIPYRENKDLIGKRIQTGWKFDAELTILDWIPRAISDVSFHPSRIQYGANVPPSAVLLASGSSRIWLGLGDRASMSIRSPGKPEQTLTLGYFPRRISLPFGVRLAEFKIERYQGTSNPMEFSSLVDIVGGNSGDVRNHLISMNEPLKYGGFTFYQASYVDGMPRPTTSVFSVNQDPGRWLKYLGSLLIVLGSIWLFLNKVLNRRATTP